MHQFSMRRSEAFQTSARPLRRSSVRKVRLLLIFGWQKSLKRAALPLSVVDLQPMRAVCTSPVISCSTFCTLKVLTEVRVRRTRYDQFCCCQ